MKLSCRGITHIAITHIAITHSAITHIAITHIAISSSSFFKIRNERVIFSDV